MSQQDARGPDGEILVEARGAVRIVTLNRPEALNAANEQLHGALAKLWPDLDASAAQNNLEVDWVEEGGGAILRQCPVRLRDSIIGHGRRRRLEASL